MLGGLGNQMFQYAFGRAVAAELNRLLVLDTTAMPTGRGQHVRRWELPSLAIAPVRMFAAGGFNRRPDRR